MGDDRQSIYRFTGSDIGLMTKFQQHFGTTRRTDLDRTFRFNDRILRASSRFITANPEQLKKELVAARTANSPSIDVRGPESGKSSLERVRWCRLWPAPAWRSTTLPLASPALSSP